MQVEHIHDCSNAPCCMSIGKVQKLKLYKAHYTLPVSRLLIVVQQGQGVISAVSAAAERVLQTSVWIYAAPVDVKSTG